MATLKCKHCNEVVFGTTHNCSKKGLLDTDEDDSFLVSFVIGAATDSALLGGALGGDLAGGLLGDILDGDLFD